jgi:2,4-dienoyl-CoA reductase-like NADH-dependent reductase (Old Yellow Enzyme family)/NADPH-dependent 2,4-dienoyl-CoA reductase/sulfur reductase-like enzyme
MRMSNFSRMFEPIEIGKMTIRNRVIMPAMVTCFASDDGIVTDQLIGYYAKRAEGGVGLIIIEGTCIDNPLGRAVPNQLCIDDEKYIPGLKKLVNAVRSYGAKIAVQLHHAGPNTHLAGAKPVGPSPVPLAHRTNEIPRELTKEEIKTIVNKFAVGAQRAQEAGFDAVELLCAHGYLLNRFLSPHANKRQDEYGGSGENRIRILNEIIDGIRTKAGKNFPILCKVPGDDYVDGGIEIEESIAISSRLKEMGVNGLTITGGSAEARFPHIAPMGYSKGWQAYLAKNVREKVNLPIAAMGKINCPRVIDDILKDGKVDLVTIGRGLIAEPELVVKTERNRVDQIIPCISCNHCLDRIYEGKALRCSVNPLAGREYDTRIIPASRPRKVLVVGGGPAGMEASIVAASRGHKVVLLEKTDRLGGQLLLAAVPSDKEEITPFKDYLIGQLEEKKVEIRLNTTGTRQVVEKLNPEIVISATGALPIITLIPGSDMENVVSAWEALRHPEKVADKVVVIGGGMVGCEVAGSLSGRGKEVTLVEQLDDVGLDIGFSTRKSEVEKLRKTAVIIMTKTPVKQITKEGVVIDENGNLRVLAAGTVVLAVGSRSDRALLEELESTKIEVRAAGDCLAPRRIVQATSQGFYTGNYI